MAEAASPRSWRKSLAVYSDRRILVMLALGFGAGLPNLLIFDTLSAWLREAGLSLSVITLFGFVTLAYAVKFLWAPLVDRTHIPLLTARLGHRRSWMLVAQAAIIAGLWLIALSDPAANLLLVAAFAVFTGISSATQDIVIDAWRIEAAAETRQGAMAAAYQWGYRIAIIVAGAVPLVLAEAYGWSLSYGVMAAFMGIGVLAVLFAPREHVHTIRSIPGSDLPPRPFGDTLEWSGRIVLLAAAGLAFGMGLTGLWIPGQLWLQLAAVVAGFALLTLTAWPVPGKPSRPGLYLSHAFGAPLANFFARFTNAAALILALICLYRISDFMLNLMNPFYLDLGFTLTQIAEVRKIYGVAMSLVGIFAGGYAIARWGLLGPLVVGAFAGPLTNLMFAWLAVKGASMAALTLAISVDNIASGFAGTCLIAYMSSLTTAGFTATQYAFFSSLYALPGKFIASQSGRVVEGVARSAEHGGVFAPLKTLMNSAPVEAFTAGAAKAGVAPAALGAGYIAFFIYTSLAGLIVIPVTLIVRRRALKKSDAQA